MSGTRDTVPCVTERADLRIVTLAQQSRDSFCLRA